MLPDRSSVVSRDLSTRAATVSKTASDGSTSSWQTASTAEAGGNGFRSVTHAAGSFLGGEQGPVNQGGHGLENRLGREYLVVADRLDRGSRRQRLQICNACCRIVPRW